MRSRLRGGRSESDDFICTLVGCGYRWLGTGRVEGRTIRDTSA